MSEMAQVWYEIWYDWCGDTTWDWSCARDGLDFISVGIPHEIEPMPEMA